MIGIDRGLQVVPGLGQTHIIALIAYHGRVGELLLQLYIGLLDLF